MYLVKADHMNLEQIANSGQCFRWRRVKENTYAIPAFHKYLEISQDGDLFTLSCDEGEWERIWKLYFDFDTDYNEVEQTVMKSNDGFLKAAYQFGSGIRILRQDLWEILISFIISQNNNIPRIKKSIGKICDETDGRFPDCYEVFDMDLSNKGLGYRDKYLKAAAAWWMREGEAAASGFRYTKEIRKHFLEIKGVGNKVADCICLFGLHHLEAFPVDTHIRKIMDREYHGEKPAWSASKYAGLLQQYIFYYELNSKIKNFSN